MAKAKKKADSKVLEKEYHELSPNWHRLLPEVKRQLESLLEESAILLSFPIQTRIKTWASIAEKLERTSLPLESIKDLQDVVGFRLVLQFQRDAEKIEKQVEAAFKIIKKYNTTDRLKDDQFGYASMHYVVELPEAWLAVPAMKGLGGLCAEIQIRTTAQHIWAEASQALQYKNEASVPPRIRRAIHRVSALLEFVDLEFERVLVERDSYKTDIIAEESDEVLNVDLISQVLDEVWPKQNKDFGQENYAELLSEMAHFGIRSRQELTSVLRNQYDEVMKREAGNISEDPNEYESKNEAMRRKRGVYFTHEGLTRMALLREFGKGYKRPSIS